MKRTFYALHEGLYAGVARRLELLQAACAARQVEFAAIDSLVCDYSALPSPGPADMLYNCARGSQVLESLLLSEQVSTVYVRNPPYTLLSSSTTWSIVHHKAGLPAPKTIFHLSADRERLRDYVRYLNGFPLILKSEGGTRGVGTIKVDSWEGLVSLADYLVSIGHKFILREFLVAEEIARLIVLGDRVVVSNSKPLATDDFRTNVHEKRIQQKKYSSSIEALAVTATHLCNLEYAGVDVLIAASGEAYLLEVNCPHDFATTEDLTGYPVALSMVDHLLSKSAQRRPVEAPNGKLVVDAA